MLDTWPKIIAFISIAMVLITILVFWMHSRAEERCDKKNGQLFDIGRGWLCLSDDGRVLR